WSSQARYRARPRRRVSLRRFRTSRRSTPVRLTLPIKRSSIMRGLDDARRGSEAHEQCGVAVTAGVTVASQGRDAAPLNWLRKRNLAPLYGRGNHGSKEWRDETDQWKARR